MYNEDICNYGSSLIDNQYVRFNGHIPVEVTMSEYKEQKLAIYVFFGGPLKMP